MLILKAKKHLHFIIEYHLNVSWGRWWLFLNRNCWPTCTGSVKCFLLWFLGVFTHFSPTYQGFKFGLSRTTERADAMKPLSDTTMRKWFMLMISQISKIHFKAWRDKSAPCRSAALKQFIAGGRQQSPEKLLVPLFVLAILQEQVLSAWHPSHHTDI